MYFIKEMIFFDKNRHCANILRNIDFKDLTIDGYKKN